MFVYFIYSFIKQEQPFINKNFKIPAGATLRRGLMTYILPEEILNNNYLNINIIVFKYK